VLGKKVVPSINKTGKQPEKERRERKTICVLDKDTWNERKAPYVGNGWSNGAMNAMQE